MFMDSPFIIILKTLELTGVGQFTNIAPTLLTIYSTADISDNYQKQETSIKITSFLTIMEREELITFDGNRFNSLGSSSSAYIIWLTDIKIMATIGTKGLKHLSDNKNQKMVYLLNKSVIETNTSTKKNFKRQIFISAMTILIAGLTAYISYLTYLKTSRDAVQEIRLKTIEESIKTLQQEKQILQHSKIYPTSLLKKKDST